MDIRVLNYFLMVAREENITRAAQLLHIAQPSLSRQLMQLEEELGVKLLHRSNRSVSLTNEGILFRRRAQDLVNIAERAKNELKQTEDVAGEIAIGCVESQSIEELSEIITDFVQLQPLVTFEIRSGNNNDIKSWLEQGTIDLGMLHEPVDVGRYDFVRMSNKDVWGVMVREDSPFLKQESIKPGELVGTPVITVIDDAIHGELTNWSGDYAKLMVPIVHYNLISNAVALVKHKVGVAVCLRLDSRHYDNMRFIPFEPKLELGSVLAWKGQQSYSKAANSFIKFVKEKTKSQQRQFEMQ